MEAVSEAQRLKEEAEIRARDLHRQQEREEQARRLAEAEAEAARARKLEEERRLEEIERRKRQEEEWRRLGSDVILDLPPVPAPNADDSDPAAIKAWYIDDETSKPTLCTRSLKPGRKPNAPPVTLADLRNLGVVSYTVSLNDFLIVKQLLKERDYKHTDEVHISQTAKDDSFLERWFHEHYNEDEQIRLIIDGSCYFDVRSKQDKWIRIHAKAGDLLVFPPGMYHRGTLDEDDYVAIFRCLRDAPRFVPVNRTDNRADSQKARLNYLMYLKKGDVATEAGFRRS